MIKFWHNSKTSVQGTVPLGISKTQSFDYVLKTLWHENNSAYINHQGDSKKITQALQNGSFQAPLSFLYSLLHHFPPASERNGQGKCSVFIYF